MARPDPHLLLRSPPIGLVLALGLASCTAGDEDLVPAFPTATDVDADAQDWAYQPTDEQGRDLIDVLFIVTAEGKAEIEAEGETMESFFAYRIDDINDTLERSLIDSSRLRYLETHVLVDDDHERTGEYPAAADQNISQALAWLTSYRQSYGADKIAIVASTAENNGGEAALGGGDVSAHWATFVPFEHEFGHCMGGGHCADGDSSTYAYGFPLAGHDADGFTNPDGLQGGTRMCGNDNKFFSNPDVTLTLAEIEAHVADGVMRDQDYAAVLGPDGTLTLGHPQFANMAQQWRDVEEEASTLMPTMKYPDGTDHSYHKPDCAGFYRLTGYRQLLTEVCAGDEITSAADPWDIASVKLGRDVHLNLYSDGSFGGSSRFGGILMRLGFSSPSLDALAAHHDLESLAGAVGSALVYHRDDRPSHFRNDGGYAFYSSGNGPYASTLDGETLVIQPDQTYWTGSAAISRTDHSLPFTVAFEYRSQTVDENHADGITFLFAKDPSTYEQQAPPRESLGFIPDGTGHAVKFATWPYGSIAVVDGQYAEVAAVSNEDTYTDGRWIDVEIEVRRDRVTVTYDGVEQLSADVDIDDTHQAIGWSAGTGAYTSEYAIRAVSITAGG